MYMYMLRFDDTEKTTVGVDATTLCQVLLDSGGKPWNLQNSTGKATMETNLFYFYGPAGTGRSVGWCFFNRNVAT